MVAVKVLISISATNTHEVSVDTFEFTHDGLINYFCFVVSEFQRLCLDKLECNTK